MCVGAFEGVVKKVVKRGRPRKNARPDDEERLDKATRTREKNAKKEAASQSSSEPHFSGSDYSESNYGMSPSDTYHDVLDAAPFINFAEPAADFKQQLPPLDAESAQAFVPVVQEKSFDNCVSPQAIQNAPSPAYSAHAMQSQHSQQSRIPMAALQMSSAYSMQSPPDLVDSFNSSSSPTASVTYYDLPDSEGTLNEMSDMFLDTFGSDLNNLEQETDLLNLMDNGKDFMCSDLTVDPFVMNMNMNNADVDALFAGADSSAWGQ
jgi:regulatory protein SWI5